MSTYVLSPNMSLPVPIVSVAPGPDYAVDVNSCMAVIDQHNHAFGNGIQITPAGLNINSDLSIQNNNVTTLRTVRFTPQTGLITATSPDIGCLYESGVDLYYNDGSGNQVRITQSGGVAGSPGSISGLVSPASASYSPGSSTFTWQSGANIPANMDMGSIIIRDITAGSNGITISPPSALAASYDITFPAALPSSTAFLTVDAAGNLGAALSTTGGIGTTQLADGSVTIPKMAAPNIVVTSSSGNFSTSSGAQVLITNLSTSIVTSGKPVTVFFQPDGTGSSASFATTADNTGPSTLVIKRGATTIANFQLYGTVLGTPTTFGPASFNFIDQPTSGTYTYSVYGVTNGVQTFSAQNIIMILREL